MAIDIGPRIGIEGEKQFKESMRAINSQIKANDAELKKLSTEYDKNNNAVNNLSQRQKVLNQNLEANQQKVKTLTAQYDRQKTKLSDLEAALENARKENGENSKEAAAAETAYKRQAEAVNKLDSQLSAANGKISELTREIKDNAQELLEAQSRAIKYGDAMQTAGDKISAAGDKINKAGNVLTVGVTTPLVAAGAAMIKYASDTEESENKVQESFKGSAEQVEEFAKTTVKEFGISRGAALDMAALFGDMGTAIGLPEKEAANVATELVGLAGDLASFKNIELDVAQSALKGIFTGETESLKNLGVVMTDSNLQAWAMKSGLVEVDKAWKDLSQKEKVMLRYKYVMEQTANAHGDYARTADGTANSLRTMQESVKEAAADFGKELLPVITPLIKEGTNLIRMVGKLDDSQKQMILRTAGIAAAAGPTLKIVGTSVNTVGKLTSGVGGLLKGLGKLSAAKSSAEALSVVSAEAAGSAKSIGGLSGILSKVFSPAGIAVVATGIVIGLGTAFLRAKSDAEKADLENHFGRIKLSAEDVEDVAKRLTDSAWKMKISAVVDTKKELESSKSAIESSLSELDKMDWKVSIGLQLTEDEQKDYLSAVESFTKSASDYIAQQGYTISLALDATIGTDSGTGEGISGFVNSYMASAQEELEELGRQLAEKVNKSFEEGTFAEDQVDIQKIHNQMNAVVQKISDAEYRAKMGHMELEYSAEGLGIDKDSFDRLNDKISENTQQLMEDSKEAQISALVGVELQYDELIESGATKEFADKVYTDASNEIKAATMNRQGEAINVGFQFAFDTVTNNFREEIGKSQEQVAQYTGDYLTGIENQINDGTFLWAKAIASFEDGLPELQGSAKKTVEDMLQSLRPQQETLQSIADECIAAGQAVPDSVKAGLDDIAKWEAMAGSASGMYMMLAQELAENPAKFEALRQTKEFGENIPQELANAITLHTGYAYNAASGMWEQVKSGSGLSAEEVAAVLNENGSTIGEALSQSLQDQYGLVYQDGKYMVEQAAKGVKDNEQTFVKQSSDLATAGITGMNKIIKQTKVGSPDMTQPDWKPQTRSALEEMQRLISNTPLVGNMTISLSPGTVQPVIPHADGGIVTSPEIGLIGEAGPEAIIPLSKEKRNQAKSLLASVEEIVRYDPFAYSASAAQTVSKNHQQTMQLPASNQTIYKFESGAIQTEITAEGQSTDMLYNEFSARLSRDVGRAVRSSRGG